MERDGKAPWIMTTVVEARVPVAWLSRSNREEIFNLRSPEFEMNELLELLVTMLSRGDLELDLRSDGLDIDEDFATTQNAVQRLLAGERSVGPYSGYFGLTRQGGERWESLALPRWDDYVDYWSVLGSNAAGIVACDQSLVGKVLQAWPYISRGDKVAAGSERWEVLRPWDTTYWKQLDEGYTVKFRTTPDTTNELVHWIERPDWVDELLQAVWHWYSLPTMR